MRNTRDELEQEVLRLRGELVALQKERDLMLEHSSDGYWDWHIAEDFEYMSPRFWEIFGYRPDEKTHHPSEWQKLIHPDELDDVLKCFEAHVSSRGEVPFDQQVRYRHKKGHWVTVRCNGRVIEWGPGGAPLRMVGTHTDLSALLETRSRAEILYASSSVGIWDWIDATSDEEYWTPHFYALLGYSFQEIPATLANFQELLHPEDRERTFSMVQDHLAGKGPFDLEYRLRHKSGAYRWFRGMGEAVFDENGKATRMVGSIQDIHDRVMAEQELRALALRHELSLKASSIGVWDWDIRENELVWDAQMYRLYGIAPDDFGSAYEAWLGGLHPDDKEAGDAQVQAALSGAREFDTEFQVIWPSGIVRRLRAIATVVRDADGAPQRMVGVNWDVSEERQRQAELARNTDELLSKNAELERFTYFASHDLQAPLRHVTSFVRLLEEHAADQLSEDAVKWMGFITDGATRMKRLIEDLLAYSKTGKGELALEEVSLGPVVDHVAQVLNVDGATSPLLVAHFALPVVRANRTQIVQLLQNLMENAINYGPADAPPRVEITAEETADEWRVHVADNGIGVPEEFQDRIFEPFQRLHPKSPHNSGIGLAICSRIVERHGGHLSVTSGGPAGSTFTFSLRKNTTDSL